MLITVPKFNVYSIRLPQELKERVEPTDEKTKRRIEAKRLAENQGKTYEGPKPTGFSGGKQGGFSLLVRQMLHLYLGEQMSSEVADHTGRRQWHLEIDDSNPLRRMESQMYALEAAVYDEGRDLAADERAELDGLERELLDVAHELAAGREPSFEQMLSLVLLGRWYALAEHLYQEDRRRK